jgi:predicted double-glycine peptidase
MACVTVSSVWKMIGVKIVIEFMTGAVIEEAASTGMQTDDVTHRRTTVGETAAPVTIVAASHAREAEMIEAEKIADKANRKGHFVVEIFQEEKIRHFVLNIRHQEADIVMNPPGMGEIAVVNDRHLLHAEKTRTNDSIVG